MLNIYHFIHLKISFYYYFVHLKKKVDIARNRVDFFFNYLTRDFQKYQEYERDCFIQSLLNIFG